MKIILFIVYLSLALWFSLTGPEFKRGTPILIMVLASMIVGLGWPFGILMFLWSIGSDIIFIIRDKTT